MKSNFRHPEKIAEEAAEWLIRLEEDGTLQCRSEFVAWLKHSPAHMDEFLLVTSAYRAMHGVDPDLKIDAAKLFEQSSPPIVALETDFERLKAGSFNWPPTLAGLAAACAVVALTAWWALAKGTDTYTTSVGEQRTVKLAEGSVVYLNTQSRIRTHFTRTSREIELLEGEALFVVERDPGRPFRVVAGSTEVLAVGTQFNVYRRTNRVTVSVIEGSVQVSAGARPSPLAAGEEANVTTNGRVTKQAVNDAAKAIAWRQRQLVFHSWPLIEIANEFNRYNKLQLRVEGSALMTRRVTGVFNADSPQTLLNFLESDTDLQVERLEDTAIIRARGGSSVQR